MTNYFSSSNKRGELQELKDDLGSTDFTRKKEAIKKVIAQMTIGKDVSSLFQLVIRCLEHSELEIKKLVYLYIINYSRKKPQDAIMVIQFFRKDVQIGSPLIKALAIRTMGCLRVPSLNEYLIDPLKMAMQDEDAYVRKTAIMCIPKVYEINAAMIDNAGLIPLMQKMLKREANALCIANLALSLLEIQSMNGEQLLQIDTIVLQKLLIALNDCVEWGQIFILDTLCNYVPKDSEETEKIMDKLSSRLQHKNSAVVFSTVKLLIKYIDYSSNPEFIRNVCKKIAQPLVTLINNPFTEIQYSVLRSIPFILQKRPNILENSIKMFFCKYDDPYYIKYEKIDLLVRQTNLKNYEMVLNELNEYACDMEIEFSRKAVKSIGTLSLIFSKCVDKCIEILLKLLKYAEERAVHIVQEILVAMMNIYRKYPKKVTQSKSLEVLQQYLKLAEEPAAISAAIWILGEYGEKIDNCANKIENYVTIFEDQERVIQLQILTAAVKIYLKFPDTTENLISKLLEVATHKTDNPDVRDRAYIYWRMLSSNPEKTKEIVLSDKPEIKQDFNTYDSNFLDQMVNNMGLVSSIVNKLPEQIFKNQVQMQPMQMKMDKNDGLPISAKPDSDEEEDDHHDQALNANNNKPMAGTLEEFKKDIEQREKEQKNKNQQQQPIVKQKSQTQIQQQQQSDNLLDLFDTPPVQQQQQQQPVQQQQQQNTQKTTQNTTDLFDILAPSNPIQNNNLGQPQNFMNQQQGTPGGQNNVNNKNANQIFDMNDENDDEDLFATSTPAVSIPYQVVLTQDQPGTKGGKGLHIEAAFVRENQQSQLKLKIKNTTANPVSNFVVQFKKNCLGVASQKLQPATVNGQQTLEISVSLQSSSASVLNDGSSTPASFVVGLKCSLDTFFLTIPNQYYVFLTQQGKLSMQDFKQQWKQVQDEQTFEIPFISEGYKNLENLKNILEKNNIFFLTQRTNEQQQNMLYFTSQDELQSIFLMELALPSQQNKNGCSVTIKSQNKSFIQFYQQGTAYLLSH